MFNSRLFIRDLFEIFYPQAGRLFVFFLLVRIETVQNDYARLYLETSDFFFFKYSKSFRKTQFLSQEISRISQQTSLKLISKIYIISQEIPVDNHNRVDLK